MITFQLKTALACKIAAVTNLIEYCENEIVYFRDGDGSDHPNHHEIANELTLILEEKIKPYFDSLTSKIEQ